jgi:hypothetical protein
MSDQEKQLNDRSPFEAALASLKPRVEGFDRERLIFLAGQAAALRERDVPAAKGTVPFLPRQKSGQSPWAWPAAFSAMTAIAAALLVMLCIRPSTTIATGGPKNTSSNVVTTELPAKATNLRPPFQSSKPVIEHDSDFADATNPESDPALRAELKRHGVDFGRPRSSSGSTGGFSSPIVMAKGPMTYFELLSRLEGQGPAGQGSLRELMQ